MLRRALAHVRSLISDRDGGLLVFSAMAMTVTLGGAALAVDIGSWYNQQRSAQKAADAAAIGGLMELMRGNASGAVNAARSVAQRNGYTTAGATTVTISRPPTSGAYSSNSNAIEVLISVSAPRLLSAVLSSGAVTINTRAVALASTAVNNICLLALHPTATAALDMTNFSLFDFNDCVPAANSTDDRAIDVVNFSRLEAPTVYTAGDVRFHNYSTLLLAQPQMTHAQPVTDPYANLANPAPSGCDWNNRHVHSVSTATIGPGVYCGGLRVNNISDLTLQPGTYYIDQGDLDFSNISRVVCSCPSTGDGVTFVLTSTGSTNQIGRVNINNVSEIILAAPSHSSFPYPGMLFYQDRRATNTQATMFTNTSRLDLDGVFYFPATTIHYTNNSLGTPGGCTVMIARTFRFTDSSALVIDECAARGIPTMSVGAPARLVE